VGVTRLRWHASCSPVGGSAQEQPRQEVDMATVPGPGTDRPLPIPGSPAERPLPERADEDEQVASPEREETPEWESEPYDPEREFAEPDVPAAVP
jgi:hypothetical protein